MSGTGTFAQGFGAIEEKYKPAMLWLYDHTFRDSDEKAGTPFDSPRPYPHRAGFTLINWPFGSAHSFIQYIIAQGRPQRMPGEREAW